LSRLPDWRLALSAWFHDRDAVVSRREHDGTIQTISGRDVPWIAASASSVEDGLLDRSSVVIHPSLISR
jgi:hypothetical protein